MNAIMIQTRVKSGQRFKKLAQSKKTGLKSTILLLFLFFLSNTAFSQNAITGTSIDLHATFNHVGIEVIVSGDANNNATATLEVNVNGAGFKPAHRLSRTHKTRFIGTAFNLVPNDNVKIRVALTDADGVTNGDLSADITTRTDAVPVSSGAEIHVATTGNDDSGNGSSGSPYATIQKAVDEAVSGSKIMLHAGRYHQFTEIAYKNNSVDNPITITNAGDGEVLIDGTDLSFDDANVWASEGDNVYSTTLNNTYYIGVDGNRLWRYNSLTDLKNGKFNNDGGFYSNQATGKTYLKLPGDAAPAGHQISVSTIKYAFDIFSASHIVFDGLTFRNFNSEEHAAAISVADSTDLSWVVNCTFENMETSVRLEGYVTDLVVMNNEFSDQGINALDWDPVKNEQWWLERGAMFITNDGFSGFGLIFTKNYVHEMFDGVKISGSEDDTFEHPNHSDVVDNIFRHLSDDGIETDGLASNIRVVNNHFENLLAGVSVAPAQIGPVYIIGNEMDSLNNVASHGEQFETMAVKFNYDGTRSGEIFVYHNTSTTFEPGQAAFSFSNSSNWDDVVIKNNIWRGTEWALYHWLDNTADLKLTEDYDLLSSESEYLVLFDEPEYTTVAAYTAATGLCGNCIAGDPLFVSPLGHDLTLQSGSPAIDAGIFIPGINDGFTGNAPDMGANEFGSTSTDTGNTDLPNAFSLDQNFPNPFNPETTIQYHIPEAGHTELVIYNTLGQKVATLVSEVQPAGQHQITWKGTDEFGQNLASGMYFYRLSAGGFVQNKKLMIVR